MDGWELDCFCNSLRIALPSFQANAWREVIVYTGVIVIANASQWTATAQASARDRAPALQLVGELIAGAPDSGNVPNDKH